MVDGRLTQTITGTLVRVSNDELVMEQGLTLDGHVTLAERRLMASGRLDGRRRTWS